MTETENRPAPKIFDRIRENRQKGLPFDISVLVALSQTATLPPPKNFDIILAKELIALNLLTLRVTQAYSFSRLGDAPTSKEETLEFYQTMGLDKDLEEVGMTFEDEIEEEELFIPELTLTEQIQSYLGYVEDAKSLLSIYNRSGVIGIFQDTINKAKDESKKGLFRKLLKRFEEIRDQAIERGIY